MKINLWVMVYNGDPSVHHSYHESIAKIAGFVKNRYQSKVWQPKELSDYFKKYGTCGITWSDDTWVTKYLQDHPGEKLTIEQKTLNLPDPPGSPLAKNEEVIELTENECRIICEVIESATIPNTALSLQMESSTVFENMKNILNKLKT